MGPHGPLYKGPLGPHGAHWGPKVRLCGSSNGNLKFFDIFGKFLIVRLRPLLIHAIFILFYQIVLNMGAYDTVAPGIPYKFEGGPGGKENSKFGAPWHGAHGFPIGPHKGSDGPHGTPNLEFSFPRLVVRDTVSYAPL